MVRVTNHVMSNEVNTTNTLWSWSLIKYGKFWFIAELAWYLSKFMILMQDHQNDNQYILEQKVVNSPFFSSNYFPQIYWHRNNLCKQNSIFQKLLQIYPVLFILLVFLNFLFDQILLTLIFWTVQKKKLEDLELTHLSVRTLS